MSSRLDLKISFSLLLAVPAFVCGCDVPETGVIVAGQGQARGRTTGTPGGAVECAQSLECGDGQVCCNGDCVKPADCPGLLCERHGQRCRLPLASGVDLQDAFICARLSQTQETGICLSRCEETNSSDGCPSASYCLNVTINSEAESVCLPSECTADGDCADTGPHGGTCVPFGNLTGFCFTAGLTPQGQTCQPNPLNLEELCSSGYYCARPRAQPDGTCQPLCDMWSGGSSCPPTTACGFLTRGTGVCSPTTGEGDAPFEPCAPAFGWCDDGVECLDFGTGGESLPVCTAYCRPQVPSDCSGVRFGNREATCATIFSNGMGEAIEDLGLCL